MASESTGRGHRTTEVGKVISRSGQQTITLTVPRKPARAGIDPRSLLVEEKRDDNVVAVQAKN